MIVVISCFAIGPIVLYIFINYISPLDEKLLKISAVIVITVLSITILSQLIFYIKLIFVVREKERMLSQNKVLYKHNRIYVEPITNTNISLRIQKRTSLILICFIFCCTPALIFNAIFIFNTDFFKYKYLDYLKNGVLVASCFNSCNNPILYAFSFPKFQQHLKQLYMKLCARS